MSRKPQLHQWVRLTSNNNQVRVKINAVTQTLDFPVGTYWMGWGQLAAAGAADSTVATGTSLLEQFETISGGDWTIRLATEETDDLPSWAALDTGYVFFNSVNSGDTIYWDDALTTMPPEWFGLAPSIAGAYGSYTMGQGSWSSPSDHGSTLVYLLGASPHLDQDGTRPVESVLQSGNGRIISTYYERVRSRFLEIALSGKARTEINEQYQQLRRWVEQMQTARALGFYYFADTAAAAGYPLALSLDINSERNQYGWKRYVLTATADLSWLPAPRFGRSFQRKWLYEMDIDEYRP